MKTILTIVATLAATLSLVFVLEDAYMRAVRDDFCDSTHRKCCSILIDNNVHIEAYGYSNGKPYRFRRLVEPPLNQEK